MLGPVRTRGREGREGEKKKRAVLFSNKDLNAISPEDSFFPPRLLKKSIWVKQRSHNGSRRPCPPLSSSSRSPFHGDKMNSALNLINPQRFHVLIPKVKGVIVLTNEVSVPPSGNKGKREREAPSRQQALALRPAPPLSAQLSRRTKVRRGGERPRQLGTEVLFSSPRYRYRSPNE